MSETVEQVRQVFRSAEDVRPGEGLAPSGEGLTPPDNDPAPGDGLAPETDKTTEAGAAIKGAGLPLNDTGNGQRFAHYCGDRAMFVPRVGWHIWDGRRWMLDPDGIAVRRLAQSIQTRILEEIPHVALEDWQRDAIATESDTRARHQELCAIEAGARSPEQAVALEDLTRKLAWIGKLKDRKSTLKSDHRRFARTSGNKGRIDAMLTEATTSLSRDIDDLDADPLTVNTESGLLRFSVCGGADAEFARVAQMVHEPHARTVAIAGRDRPQVITKLMPVGHDPAARCPRFDAFLLRVQPDREMRQFLRRWWGLSMTALPVQKFVFQHGKGANGKSVLSDLMNRILGDYAATVKIKSLTGRDHKSGSDATPDLMPLVGARAALACEPEQGERLQEGMIKEMTGGEPILVRQLHSDFIEVRPHFKLTVSGNHKPEIRGTDDGIWRRVLLVPFDVQIPEAERDEALIDKLWDERSGILNWLIEGLIDVLEGGLRAPERVLGATREYRADSDPVGTFLAECCLVSGSSEDFLTARELIDGFNLWLDQRGEGMWGQRTVSLRIRAEANRYRDPTTGRPYTRGKRTGSGYFGIRFTEPFRTSYDDAPRNSQGRPVACSPSSGRSSPDVRDDLL